ncbi:MAG TPA: family 16 glycoside hydrolase, partial [Longimicrobiales bacterium]|nr:family 16 glycoside hydrolase [Longimicrobiales bacterium]
MNGPSHAAAAAGLFAALALGACAPPEDASAPPRPHNTLTAREETDGWILLFDGVSTEGWRGYNMDRFPEEGWAVDDGTLVVFASDGSEEGLGGDIVTEGVFD